MNKMETFLSYLTELFGWVTYTGQPASADVTELAGYHKGSR